jgi:hypothetical protein
MPVILAVEAVESVEAVFANARLIGLGIAEGKGQDVGAAA